MTKARTDADAVAKARDERRERLRAEHAKAQAERDAAEKARKEQAKRRAVTSNAKDIARARARIKALDPSASGARAVLLRRVAEILDEARALGEMNAAIGAARLLLDSLPPDAPTEQRPFASAREALAWWRENEAAIETAAKRERPLLLAAGETGPAGSEGNAGP